MIVMTAADPAGATSFASLVDDLTRGARIFFVPAC